LGQSINYPIHLGQSIDYPIHLGQSINYPIHLGSHKPARAPKRVQISSTRLKAYIDTPIGELAESRKILIKICPRQIFSFERKQEKRAQSYFKLVII